LKNPDIRQRDEAQRAVSRAKQGVDVFAHTLQGAKSPTESLPDRLHAIGSDSVGLLAPCSVCANTSTPCFARDTARWASSRCRMSGFSNSFSLDFAGDGPDARLHLAGRGSGSVATAKGYSSTALRQVLFYYALFLAIDWVSASFAFLLEKKEHWRLLWWLFLQRFCYRQVMYYVMIKSVAVAARGTSVGWGKLDRKATVEAQP